MPGGDFDALIAFGNHLTYKDGQTNTVSLSLSHGGSMELIEPINQTGGYLELAKVISGKSILSGKVKAGKTGTGMTMLEGITGLGGAIDRLPSNEFSVTNFRLAPFDLSAPSATDAALLAFPDTLIALPDPALARMTNEGYRILTWNGLGFDFDILAEESCAAELCGECALGHVDMMFQVFCTLGYPIGLEKAAQGMGLPGKPAGMSGAKAPKLWAEGHFNEVLSYVAQDVRIALEIAQACERRRRLEWITRKGTRSSMPLPAGWITVKQALLLPEPDTSWMSSPIPRRDFIAWLRAI